MKYFDFLSDGCLLALIPTLLSFSQIVSTSAATIPADSTSMNAAMLSTRDNPAGCYHSGSFGNRNWLNQRVLGICLDYLSGWYGKARNGRSRCQNTGLLGAPRSYWFAIYNLDPANDREMDFYSCEKYMKQISNQCDQGGEFDFAGWRFALDPQTKPGCSE